MYKTCHVVMQVQSHVDTLAGGWVVAEVVKATRLGPPVLVARVRILVNPSCPVGDVALSR